jgi:cysteine desulfurase/selenocysteine lyase
MRSHWERIQELAIKLRERLSELPNIKVMDIGSQNCGIVTFVVDDQCPYKIMQQLRDKGINISVSDPSSTLIDSTRRKLPPILRASVHYYNDEGEIDCLIEALPYKGLNLHE